MMTKMAYFHVGYIALVAAARLSLLTHSCPQFQNWLRKRNGGQKWVKVGSTIARYIMGPHKFNLLYSKFP